MIFHCNSITAPLSECTLALGTFDGVHIGHMRVIGSAVMRARELGISARVLTFPELPGDSIETRARAPKIMSNSQREKAIFACGVDDICYFELKNGGADYTAERFVEEIICGKLKAKSVFCGFNFRFGKGGAADVKTLARLLEEKGIALTVSEPVTLDGEPVSSSKIRSLISQGDVESAAIALGRPYSTDFEVEQGNRIGRSIGFPTVNNRFPKGRLLPAFGVYATKTLVGGKEYGSVTNIGTRPTVGGQEVTEETHILGFSGDIYGEKVEVEYIARLRNEKYFENIEELRRQIENDVARAEEILKNKTNNSAKERE